MQVDVYICIYIYIYTYICIYILPPANIWQEHHPPSLCQQAPHMPRGWSIYTYTYLYICIYIYIHTYTYMQVDIYTCIYIYIYIYVFPPANIWQNQHPPSLCQQTPHVTWLKYIYIPIQMYICIHIYIYMQVDIYICIYVYIYIYICLPATTWQEQHPLSLCHQALNICQVAAGGYIYR